MTGLKLVCCLIVLSLQVLIVHAGKEFSLAASSDIAVYSSGSEIDVNLIGEGFPGSGADIEVTEGGALLCHTDDSDCCTDRGDWLYPNGSALPNAVTNTKANDFYRTRGPMVVRLNRRRTPLPFPRSVEFTCEIKDENGNVIVMRSISLINSAGNRCPRLSFENGSVTYAPNVFETGGNQSEDVFIGTIALYNCSVGYELVGSPITMCQFNGGRTAAIWNSTEPYCRSNETGEGSAMTTDLTPDNQTTEALTKEATSTTSSTMDTTESSKTTDEMKMSTSIDRNSTEPPTSDNMDTTKTVEQADNNMVAIIAAAVPSVFLIAASIIIIAVIICIRRRRAGKPRRMQVVRSDDYHMMTVTSASKLIDSDNAVAMATTSPDESDQSAPVILGFPMNLSPTEGEGLVIEAKVEGNPPPTLTWYHDDNPIVSGYSIEVHLDQLSIERVQMSHSGVFKLVAANLIGQTEKEVIVSVVMDEAVAVVTDPIPVDQFGQYVADKHAQGNRQFRTSFETLSDGEAGHMTLVSLTPENKLRNRFKNISVYDDNLIKLRPLTAGKETFDNEYINASYVDGFSVKNKFLAAQGPMPNTLVDFWRMIWQERPSAIVMLTNCVEGGKVKCEKYWPDGHHTYGPFTVITTDQQIRADYTARKFVISCSAVEDQSFIVTHFHFTSWPDHGVPTYATPLLSFQRLISAYYVPPTGPIIVHCSAGVGRTGTYIVLDNVLDQIRAEGLVDIDGLIVKARNQRMKMVQSKEQYIFIHDAILEFLTCGDTQISTTNLRMEISKLSEVSPLTGVSGFQRQFEVLEQVSPNPDEVHCTTAARFPDKNRGSKFLPVETSRVILRGESPDYIHAVTANGYKQQKAYIIAQNPLEATIRNFWKAITDRKCGVIVMLAQPGEDACAQYWPSEEAVQFGEFSVKLIDKKWASGFITRKMIVESSKLLQAQTVTQYHLTNWEADGSCSNLKVITDLIEEVAKTQRRTGNNPIMVHCNDTVTRSAAFCAISITISRCQTEGVVDVFQVVKALRVHKPGAVLSVELYKMIHETVLAYLDSFDTYANFKNVV